MPNYDFFNKDTNEIEEHSFSYTKLDEFKENNPHLEMYFTGGNLPVLSDGIRLSIPGVKKCDSTFQKYVIDRIKHGVGENTLAETHKHQIPREW